MALQQKTFEYLQLLWKFNQVFSYHFNSKLIFVPALSLLVYTHSTQTFYLFVCVYVRVSLSLSRTHIILLYTYTLLCTQYLLYYKLKVFYFVDSYHITLSTKWQSNFNKNYIIRGLYTPLSQTLMLGVCIKLLHFFLF